MKLSLTIEGCDASTLAMILTSLPAGAVAIKDTTTPSATVQPMQGVPVTVPMGMADDADDDASGGVAVGALDANGLPWDERIHAGTKTLKGDGTWTGRRGGPKGEALAAIEAELRARVAAMSGTPQPQPMPQMTAQPQPMPQMTAQPQPMPVQQPIAAPVINPHIPQMGQPAPMMAPQPQPMQMPANPEPAPVMAQPQPMPVQQPVAAPAPQPQQGGAMDFAQFMQHVAGQTQKRDANGAPLIHADYLNAVAAEIAQQFQQPSVATITDIASNPAMIDYAIKRMQMDGRW